MKKALRLQQWDILLAWSVQQWAPVQLDTGSIPSASKTLSESGDSEKGLHFKKSHMSAVESGIKSVTWFIMFIL